VAWRSWARCCYPEDFSRLEEFSCYRDPQFDHIALLSAPADVLLARIAARTGNPYGKHPAERAQILRDLAAVEPLLRATATIEIDATAPLPEVVRRLEAVTILPW